MKKIVSLLLSVGLVLSLAACGSDKTTETTASPVDTSNIKMGRVEYAAHGTKSFAVAIVAMSGDTIIGASLDEYQFMDKSVATGVPNSDKDFGQNYKDPNIVLASKKANAEYYSEHMKEAAGATTPINESMDAIEKFVTGKTITDLEKTLDDNSPEEMVDAVSGATLVDTKGYVEALLEAAKAAK